MEFLIGIAIISAITVLPIMVAAKLLGAAHTGFFRCLLAVIVSAAANHIGDQLFGDSLVSLLASFAITALGFAIILGAGYLQALGISLLAIGIQVGTAILLAVMGLAMVQSV